MSGRQLGDYQILRRLGQGAMAEVYLAEQCSLSRKVAVKILKRHLAADETFIRRFRQEAQAAASLVNAHIVQIHEVGCVDGVHFIAQEYVAGQNLRELIARHGPPGPRLSITIMCQVAAALNKAAEQGIVHRDIKPENIMISRAGEVKVADFGLARATSGDGTSATLTQVGITMGTPLYMSPEQVEGRRLDPRSDIYSFGVTCYHMLAGRPPFDADTPLGLALQHLKQQPERLENIRADLPESLCRIVHRMLEKQPSDRYASPRELLKELRQVQIEGLELGELDVSDTASIAEFDTERTETMALLTQAMKTPSRGLRHGRKRLAWITAIAAAMLLGGAAAYALRQPDPLAGSDPGRTGVDKKPSVFAQWVFAMQDGTEEGWLSIEQHFPKETYFVLRAKQQLARIYLMKNRRQDADRLFQEFMKLPDSDSEFVTFGMAGHSIVLSFEGQYRESQKLLNEITPRRLDLVGSDMGRMLFYVSAANRRALKEQGENEMDAWLKENFGEGSEGDG